MNLILTIPSQRFHFLETSSVDDENINLKFDDMCEGTIFIFSDVFEGEEDTIIPFGLKDGEEEAKIAFWDGWPAIRSAWDNLIEEKHKLINSMEVNK